MNNYKLLSNHATAPLQTTSQHLITTRVNAGLLRLPNTNHLRGLKFYILRRPSIRNSFQQQIQMPKPQLLNCNPLRLKTSKHAPTQPGMQAHKGRLQ